MNIKRQKIKKNFFYLLILTGTFILSSQQKLTAITWAILPARFSGDFSIAADGFEISRQVVLYLEYGGLSNFVSPAKVAAAYRALEISPTAAISLAQAAKIADSVFAERLLLLHIVQQNKNYSIESRIYHRESSIVTDSLITKNSTLPLALGEHLRLRFSQFQVPLTALPANYDFILITEASGGNYLELQQLSKTITSLPISRSALCAIDHTGRLFSQGLQTGKAIIGSLTSLTARGNQAAQQLSQAVTCAREIARQHNLKKAIFVLLVSDWPANLPERARLKGHLRLLTKHGKLLILVSGSVTPEGQNYYQNLASELPAVYQDILYRNQVGLANGESWYIFKRGDYILEGRHPSGRDASAIIVPVHLRAEFRPQRLVEIYSKLSQNQVIAKSNTEILLLEPLLKLTNLPPKPAASENIHRVLLQFPEGSFWLSIPQKTLNQTKSLKKGDTLTLAVLLAAPQEGIPLVNDPAFVKIFNSTIDTPKELYLPLSSYLQNPERYLQQSIGGTSLYILQGRFIESRVPRSDLLENLE